MSALCRSRCMVSAVRRFMVDSQSILSPRRSTIHVTDWMSRHTALPLDTLSMLSHVVPESDRQKFALFRDLLGGVSEW